MATKIIQPQISSSHLIPQNPKIKTSINSILSSNPRCIYPRFKLYPSGFKPNFSLRASAEEQSSNVLDNEKDTIALTKANIYQAVEGINRGAFGVTSTKKREIEDLVVQLESLNPTPNPTLNLDKVSGCWKLIYSTITILGSKRTKLGLRDFIILGDFLQIIDVAEGKAVNVIKFSARGLNLLNGQLTIQASFSFASQSRVNIKYDNSHITPDQLMNLFKKNYDLLLSIFNPEGWLDITYLDDTLRIGRDDKGNIFVLERSSDD